MEQVLKLDKGCEEAANDLFYCKVLQLMVCEGVESAPNYIHVVSEIFIVSELLVIMLTREKNKTSVVYD